MKTIVIYYSWRGKTELVARAIAETISADLKRIEEVKERKGLFGFISGGYQAAREKYSRIKPLAVNLALYDLIFIGTPVWAAKPSPAVNSFINQQNFSGKKVVLFCTMGGFGGEKACRVMKDKIEKRGGEVIARFCIKTGGMERGDIIKEGEKIGRIFLKREER